MHLGGLRLDRAISFVARDSQCCCEGEKCPGRDQLGLAGKQRSKLVTTGHRPQHYPMKHHLALEIVLLVVVASLLQQSSAQLFGPKRQATAESGGSGEANVDGGRAAQASRPAHVSQKLQLIVLESSLSSRCDVGA